MKTVFGVRGRRRGGPVGVEAIAALVVLDAASLEELALLEAASELARQVNWLNSRRAGLLAELAARDTARDAQPDRVGSGKQWLASELALMTGLADSTARGQLRTATALERLPLAAAGLRAGELSWAHVHELAAATAHADDAAAAEVERRVLADPRVLTPHQLRQTARRHVLALAPEAAKADTPIPTAASFIDREGNNRFTATLDPLGAQIVADAVESAATKTGPDDDRTVDHRRADALVEIAAFWLAHHGSHPTGSTVGDSNWAGDCSERPAGGCGCHQNADGSSPSECAQRLAGGGQRPQVTVTVGLTTLLGLDETPGRLANGQYIGADTARRLACDANLTRLVEQPLDGGIIDLGRSSRFPSPKQRARILARDQGCRFPTCNRGPARAEVHHIQEWENGGPTDENNLLTTCPRHHSLLHEGHWHVQLHGDNTTTWTSPHHRSYTSAAPGAEPPQPDW